MVKKENILILLLLLACLWIYTFYRPDTILINEIWQSLHMKETFNQWRTVIATTIPLPHWMIYNLPEAMWIACLSICCQSVFVPWQGKRLSLRPFPIVYAISLEIFQYFHITNGTFDFWDILASFVAWFLIIQTPLGRRHPPHHLFHSNKDAYRLWIVFFIVVLAHFSGDSF